MKRLTHSEMRGGSESQVVVVVVVVVHWLLLSDLVLQCNHQPQLTTHSRRQLPDKAWEQVVQAKRSPVTGWNYPHALHHMPAPRLPRH